MLSRPASPVHRAVLRTLAASLALVAGYACGGSDTEQAGQPCAQPSDCYPDIDPKTIKGEIQCLTKVSGGYCTHLCETDADCCAVEGECKGDHPQVCAPFENTNQKMCFLSCEAKDVGDLDPNAYCQQFANEAFGCRSTGGGAENRQICSP
jgi:hypothetical protein